MERIDRQQRLLRKALPTIGDSRSSELRHDAQGGDSACQWLDAAMAMWIAQDEARGRPDRDLRGADAAQG